MDEDLGKKLFELQCKNTIKHAPYPQYVTPEWFEIPESARQAWRDTAENFRQYVFGLGG